jgi:hypothetical protein
MSDAQRCEPPEHLRGVDGWHWVQAPVGDPHLARWHAAERADVEPLWTSTHHVYSGTPRYAVREWGCRYHSPVAPPDLVRELVAALEKIAAPLDLRDVPHVKGNAITWRMEVARAALQRAKEAGV